MGEGGRQIYGARSIYHLAAGRAIIDVLNLPTWPARPRRNYRKAISNLSRALDFRFALSAEVLFGRVCFYSFSFFLNAPLKPRSSERSINPLRYSYIRSIVNRELACRRVTPSSTNTLRRIGSSRNQVFAGFEIELNKNSSRISRVTSRPSKVD